MPATSLFRRLTATVLVGSLALLSAGIAPYEAIAAELRAGGAEATASLPAATAPGLPGAALGGPASLALPTAGMEPGALAVPAAGPEAGEPAAQRAAAEVSAASRGVDEKLQALGDVSAAPAGAAHETGEALQVLISGRRAAAYSAAVAAPSPAAMASVAGITLSAASGDQYHAQPAGQDSIGAPAQQFFGNGPVPPTPPTGGPQGPQDQEPRQPLLPRLLTSAVTLLPAAFLGWPLVAAGSLLAGSLVIAASLGLAVMPFMGERTPGALRAAPGVALSALGAVTLAAGFAAGSWMIMSMGAAVALGGWGFMRFALGKDERRGTSDTLETLLGGLGAAAGAGLVLLQPAGWLAFGLTLAAYPVTLLLFMHLPGWVGAGIRGAAEAFSLSVQDSVHATLSLSRDTTQRKRLEAYTKAHIDHSNWNALWLGLLIWLPLGLIELAKTALAFVAGLAQGAFRALPMFAWSAAHKLAPGSSADRFLARWTQAAFFAQKARAFNALETPLLLAANSDYFVARLVAGVVITLAQLAWLIAATVATPFAAVFGWVQSLRDPIPANENLDPRYFKLQSDPLPAKVPGEMPKPAVTSLGAWASRLTATAIGAAPLKLIGLALWSAGFEGMGVVIALAGVALMPIMPEGDWMPSALRRLPGWTMSATAAATLYYGAMSWWVGLPTGFIVPLAAVALLGGFGFSQMIDGLRNETTKKYQVDNAEYIGGFGAALALLSALGAAMLGLTGWVPLALTVTAFVLSPLLLYHLGRPFWSGVWSGATAWLQTTGKTHEVMDFWSRDSRFSSNLSAWYRYWLNKSAWNGAIVFVPFLVAAAFSVVDGLVSLAVGLAAWPLRAVTAFLSSRAQAQGWDSDSARFWRAFHEYLVDSAEGSKKTAFDPFVAKLIPAMNELSEKTSRPTVKALLALTAARFVQVGWLIYVAVMLALTPVMLIPAFLAGRKAAAEKPKN